jgi:hypothetical protein
MKILSKEEVAKLLKLAVGRNRGPVLFKEEVEKMEPGQAFAISPDEWPRKTSIPGYFSGKFNKGGTKVVKVVKQADESYLVVKL